MNQRTFRTAKEAWADLAAVDPKSLPPGAEAMFYAGISAACMILAGNYSTDDHDMEEAIIDLVDEVQTVLEILS
jgi:hypothetical protein